MALEVRRVAEDYQDDLLDLLSPGDTVMTTVTHEVTIDGEKSWIKHGATTTVRLDETADQARERLSKYVTIGALKEVGANVEQVRAFIASNPPF